jgi:hypothetical protein
MHGSSIFVYAQQIEQDEALTEATSIFTIYYAKQASP